MKKLILLLMAIPMFLPGQQFRASGSWFGVSEQIVLATPDVPFVYASSWVLWMAEDMAMLSNLPPENAVVAVPFTVEENTDHTPHAIDTRRVFEAREHE